MTELPAATPNSRPTFEALVVTHGPMVLRICRAVLGPVDADDAWSETFLSAFRAQDRLPRDADVSAWLATIAYRKAVDVYRRRRRVPPGVPSGAETATLAPDAADEPLGDHLSQALWTLTERQRSAVVYRHIVGLSYDELSITLDCSPDAARRAVSDGLAKLRLTYRPAD